MSTPVVHTRFINNKEDIYNNPNDILEKTFYDRDHAKLALEAAIKAARDAKSTENGSNFIKLTLSYTTSEATRPLQTGLSFFTLPNSIRTNKNGRSKSGSVIETNLPFNDVIIVCSSVKMAKRLKEMLLAYAEHFDSYVKSVLKKDPVLQAADSSNANTVDIAKTLVGNSKITSKTLANSLIKIQAAQKKTENMAKEQYDDLTAVGKTVKTGKIERKQIRTQFAILKRAFFLDDASILLKLLQGELEDNDQYDELYSQLQAAAERTLCLKNIVNTYMHFVSKTDLQFEIKNGQEKADVYYKKTKEYLYGSILSPNDVAGKSPNKHSFVVIVDSAIEQNGTLIRPLRKVLMEERSLICEPIISPFSDVSSSHMILRAALMFCNTKTGIWANSHLETKASILKDMCEFIEVYSKNVISKKVAMTLKNSNFVANDLTKNFGKEEINDLFVYDEVTNAAKALDGDSLASKNLESFKESLKIRPLGIMINKGIIITTIPNDENNRSLYEKYVKRYKLGCGDLPTTLYYDYAVKKNKGPMSISGSMDKMKNHSLHLYIGHLTMSVDDILTNIESAIIQIYFFLSSYLKSNALGSEEEKRIMNAEKNLKILRFKELSVSLNGCASMPLIDAHAEKLISGQRCKEARTKALKLKTFHRSDQLKLRKQNEMRKRIK